MSSISPGLWVMYASLAWLVLSTAAGILIGRAIRVADEAEKCCGMCDQ